MMRSYLLAATLVALPQAFASLVGRSDDEMAPCHIDTHIVHALFLNAVDRGELMLLGDVVGQSAIIVREVRYVHNMQSGARMLIVISDLVSPRPLPDTEQFEIRSLHSILTVDGHIAETDVHALPKTGSGSGY